MSRPFRILLLDDSPLDAELIERELRDAGLEFEVMHAMTRDAFNKALFDFGPDLVLSDYSIPFFGGQEALGIVRAASKDLPFVLVSGSIGEEAAIEIMKGGATDYVLKDRLVRLAPAVSRALAEAEQRTRRQDAEQALAKRAAELERSNAELEQFAYICSHDLREPLRMITMFCELIEAEVAERLSEESRGYMLSVLDGTLRMRQMLDGLLQYSQVHSDHAETLDCDSSKALRAALENLASTLQQSAAVVTSCELPVVHMPESHLIRVFQNLIGNGIKFNHSVPPRIEVRVERDGSHWVFSVLDNGIGIEPHHRERAFKMFQRLHNRGVYPGEGIGLSVCRRVVQRFGGRIWIDSNPGGGAIVWFTIPIATGSASAATRPSAA